MDTHTISFDLYAKDGYSYPVRVEIADTSEHPPRRVAITIAAPAATPEQLPEDHIYASIARCFLTGPQLISSNALRVGDQRTKVFDGSIRDLPNKPWRWENVIGAIPSRVS